MGAPGRGTWFPVLDQRTGEEAARVRGVVPGELVEVAPDPDDPPWGRITRVLEPSPHRVNPPCGLSDACGGCHWMHMSPAAQRTLRIESLARRLTAAGLPTTSAGIEDVPAPSSLGYRYRARLQAAPLHGARGGALGFHAPASRKVVDLPACPLFAPPLAAAYAALRATLDAEGMPHDLTGIELTVLPGGGPALALLNPRDRPPASTPASSSPGLVLTGEYARPVVTGSTPAGWPVAAAPGVFVQSSLGGADRLVDAVLDRVAPERGVRVLELYAGSGLLGWACASRGARVTGVESSPHAVAASRAMPAPDAPGEFDVVRASARDALESFRSRTTPPIDVVLADPPRAGLADAAAPLLALHPPRIVLVCCSAESFAADARRLAEGGYVMSRPAVVDMFPHTRHTEVLAAFTRSGGGREA